MEQNIKSFLEEFKKNHELGVIYEKERETILPFSVGGISCPDSQFALLYRNDFPCTLIVWRGRYITVNGKEYLDERHIRIDTRNLNTYDDFMREVDNIVVTVFGGFCDF